MNESVILVRPTRQGNVGATARAMANMGLDQLILVEPAAPIGDEARAFAFGAGHVLAAARRVDSLDQALAPFARVVGTTSSRNRALSAPLVDARELPALLPMDSANLATALVFGPEASGLTAEELSHCGILVHIPCSPVQPTLNLSQAVLVVAYELHMARLAAATAAARIDAAAAETARATHAEVEGLVQHANHLLHAAGFARDSTFDGVLADLRALAVRSPLTPREVTILRGICRRLGHALARRESAAPTD